MMTFKEYRKQTKITSKYCFRINGILFSVCFCLIYLFAGESAPFIEHLLMLVVCILLGNLFAIYICVIAIYASFKKLNILYGIIEELPKDIIDDYEIKLFFEKKDVRYNYPEGKIYGHKDNYLIQLNSNKPNAFIILVFMPDGLWQNRSKINRKYKRENIELTGFGFTQKLKLKELRSITKNDFDKRVQRLIEISSNKIV
ncbi:MAG: hypothetical protein Q4F69_06535 [Bacteroidia bacterium]|nr:hypothetical protein [Bacteroidia bacterium]